MKTSILSFVFFFLTSFAAAELMPPSGMFSSPCALSHRAPDDPIVFPGRPGESHMHDFYGSTRTNAFTTDPEHLDGPTSCDIPWDNSGYWIPTLYSLKRGVDASTVEESTDHSVDFFQKFYDPVEPDDFIVYYRQTAENPRDVRSFPKGLRIIAGWQREEGTSAADFAGVVRFGCEDTRTASHDFVKCAADRRLVATIDFPDCWDGSRLESFPTHNKHVAYREPPSTANGPAVCPDSHPVAITAVTFKIVYNTTGDSFPFLRLSAHGGKGYDMHADLFSNWAETDLHNRMDKCIAGKAICDVVLKDEDTC